MANTQHKYISKTQNGGYLFSVPRRLNMDRTGYGFKNLQEAIEKRNEVLGYDPDVNGQQVVKGEAVFTLPPSAKLSDADLWIKAEEHEVRMKTSLRDWHVVNVGTDLPIGIVWFGDQHFGGPYVGYSAARKHAQIVEATEGMYCEVHSDHTDNWIVGRLKAFQRDQIMSHKEEIQLSISWLKMIKDSLLWMVAGNHDAWTESVSGIDLYGDFIPHLLQTKYIYEPIEARIRLALADNYTDVIVRHKWSGTSQYNDTHGIEKAWKFGAYEFNIGVGGHTHLATLCRPFVTRKDTIAHAILVGTYKYLEPASVFGSRKPTGFGAGVSIIHPTGEMDFFYNVERAAEYLTWLREQYRTRSIHSVK